MPLASRKSICSLSPSQPSGERGPVTTPTSISRSNGNPSGCGVYTLPTSKSLIPSRLWCWLAANVERMLLRRVGRSRSSSPLMGLASLNVRRLSTSGCTLSKAASLVRE